MKSLIAYWVSRKKTVMITFEIFWIIVFLLKIAADQAGSSIPQFIYVNF